MHFPSHWRKTAGVLPRRRAPREALEALTAAARDLPGEIVAYPGDVTDTSLMAEHCRSIERDMGGIALLVANAGIYLPQDGLGC